MTQFTAGDFTVDVSDPHPCWIEVGVQGRPMIRMSHREIVDLQLVLERAKQEAIRKLGPKYKDEVL